MRIIILTTDYTHDDIEGQSQQGEQRSTLTTIYDYTDIYDILTLLQLIVSCWVSPCLVDLLAS
jgi:hypothetical protein